MHFFRGYIEQINFDSSYIPQQPPKGVLRQGCSENMQQFYRRTPMPKCDFNKVAKQLKSYFCMGVFLYICCIFPEHFWVAATGYDSISIRMLKISSLCIIKPLSIIFQKCLKSSIFPDD